MKFFRKCVSVMIPDLIKCLLFYIDHTKLLVIPWNVCLSEGDVSFHSTPIKHS